MDFEFHIVGSLVRQRVRILFALLLLLPASVRAADPLLTDPFADRQVITTTRGELDSSNVGASVEPGEPRHGGKVGGHSVWVSWIAPEDGIATFRTDGSSFDTLLSAYHFDPATATSLDRLREDARNDDSPGIAPASLIQIGAQAGVRYEIALDGFAGATGTIHLSWDFLKASSPPPIIVTVPDDRAARQGDAVTLTVDMPISDRLKFNWRFNGNDLVGAESPSVFIPSLQPENVGIYTLRITMKGGNNISFETRPIELQINSEGETNTLARDKLFDALESGLHGRDDARGGTGLGAGVVRAAALAPGRVTAAATGVARGYNGSQIFDTTFATTDPSEPLHCGISRNFTYWLSYDPPTNGVVTLDTLGSTYDTVLAVYTYQSPLASYAELVSVNCDHASVVPGGASRVTFDAGKGRQYAFVVAAAGTQHAIAHLNYALALPNPPEPPSVASLPAARTVAVGSDVTLQAVITGSQPMQYQWQKTGVLMPEQKGASLHLLAVGLSDSGDYTFTVSNASGVPLAVVFTLKVIARPQVELVVGPDQMWLTFPTEAGLHYIVESSIDPASSWTTNQDIFIGTGQALTLTNRPDVTSRFYRIRIQ